MKRLRVGIIGQGRSGRNIHAQVLGQMPGRYRIAVVSDLIPARCRRAEVELGCDSVADYHAMLGRGDLDLIVNATPTPLHVPVSREVIQAGINVLAEKPLSARAADADELAALARNRGCVFAVYQQSRFAPYYQKILKIIESGVLGRIVMVKVAFNAFSRRWDWQTCRDQSGGNLLNTGPHPLDQVLGLFGRDTMPEVWCRMDRANTFGDAEDHVKVLLSGPGRPTIDIEVSSCCAQPLYNYQLYGTQGGLTGAFTQLQWRYFKPEEAPERALIREPLPDMSYCAEQLKWYERSWKLPKSQTNWVDGMGQAFYCNLYDAIRHGAPLAVPPEHVRQQLAVFEICRQQAAPA